MSHLSDKELDRLSREAAEQYDVEQNTSGWDALHLRLNKEMPENQRKQRRSLLLLLSLIVLLTGSGLVYHYANGPALPLANQSVDGVAQDEALLKRKQGSDAEKQPGSGKNNNATDVSKPLDQPSPGTNANNDVPATTSTNNVTEKNIPVNAAATKEKTISSKQKPPASNNIGGTIKGKNNSVVSGSTIKTKKDRVPDLSARSARGKNEAVVGGITSGEKSKSNPVTSFDEDSENNINSKADPKPSIVKMADASGMTSIQKPAIDRTNALSDHATSGSLLLAATHKKEQKLTDRKFPLSFSVIGGADWTTVRYTHKDNVGFNAGVTISWHFAKNFSLITGAVYTKKNYSAFGKDYHPPKGYWTNYITLDELNGSCWMIDIPLNVRYDFAGGKKYSLFASAGASTYLMDRESYTYHYMYNGTYTSRKWLNDDNSSYIFSILNLSAGYEKEVGKNLSVQVEPYLKLPLSGIGFGKMQMNSYGVNFAIRFRPELKK